MKSIKNILSVLSLMSIQLYWVLLGKAYQFIFSLLYEKKNYTRKKKKN
jgi:hypothetical protein